MASIPEDEKERKLITEANNYKAGYGRLLEKIKEADVVIGSQHMKNAKMENIPLWRVLVSKAAIHMDRFFLGVKLSSVSSFFVAYKKDIIKNLVFRSNGFDAQCEILVKLYKKGYKIKEIPCTLRWSDNRKNRLTFKKLLKEIEKRIRLWVYLNKNIKNET